MVKIVVTQDYGPVSLDDVDALTLNWNQIQWLVPAIILIILVLMILMILIILIQIFIT